MTRQTSRQGTIQSTTGAKAKARAVAPMHGAAAPPPDDAIPDTNALRLSITRKLNDVLRNYIHCRFRTCRRARRCIQPQPSCVSRRTEKSMNEERHARVAKNLRLMLQKRIARVTAEEAMAESAQGARRDTAVTSPHARGRGKADP